MAYPKVPPRLVLTLLGASVASGIFAFSSRQAYRRVALGVASGAAGGAAFAYYNDTYHCVESLPVDTSKAHVVGTLPNPYRRSFRTMRDKIFEHLSERYEELGQLEEGEASITVQDHVFAQIGVIDEDGIRKLWRMVTLDLQQMPKYGLTNAQGAAARHVPVVFCDLGSGVGNVCLQILAETSCNSVVGIEIIPSRHRAAETAFKNAQNYYPEVFDQNKHADFLMKDIVECGEDLNQKGVNVLFTHSWMFDDDLMTKLTKVVREVPSLKMVVTSRPLDEAVLASTNFRDHKLVHFSADWNEAAPFHVYMRAVN